MSQSFSPPLHEICESCLSSIIPSSYMCRELCTFHNIITKVYSLHIMQHLSNYERCGCYGIEEACSHCVVMITEFHIGTNPPHPQKKRQLNMMTILSYTTQMTVFSAITGFVGLLLDAWFCIVQK